MNDFRGLAMVMRVVRVMRVARIFKLARYSSGLKSFGLTVQTRFHIYTNFLKVVMF